MITTQLVGLEEIQDAARVLAPAIVRTPLLRADAIAEKIGAPVWVKPEVLQRGGAFKFRGAFNFLSQLNPEARERGVVAPSSGNHAQAVALAAKIYGVPATVVMPTTVTPAKRAGAERLGARIVLAGTTTTDRLERAQELVAEEGLTLVPPYDHPWIIAGQGTVGLEIVEDLPDVAAVLVPIGGGGLASGVAVAVRALASRARVIGVEPELAADARQSLAEGRIVRWAAADVSRTIADGTRTTALGQRTFAHLSALLDRVVTVPESEIAAAVRLAAEESRLVVEPSGALSIAALAFHAAELGLVDVDGPVVAVVSGGNVDPDRYRAYLEAPIPPRG